MDILELLAEARAAGLVVRAEGEMVVVTGPKEAEPIVERLKERKAELLEVIGKETSDMSTLAKKDMSNMSNGALPSPHDPEVIDEARAMLERNPNFWSWEQALEGARRIIGFKRGQMAALPKADPPALVEMTPTGCKVCGGKEYWLTTDKKRLCLSCNNDGRLALAQVVTIGSLPGEKMELKKKDRQGSLRTA